MISVDINFTISQCNFVIASLSIGFLITNNIHYKLYNILSDKIIRIYVHVLWNPARV